MNICLFAYDGKTIGIFCKMYIVQFFQLTFKHKSEYQDNNRQQLKLNLT